MGRVTTWAWMLASTAIAWGMIADHAAAQTQEQPSQVPSSQPSGNTTDPQSDTYNVDAIIVTGTRRVDRTVLQSSAPIDVFTAQDLERQGSSDLNTVLRTLVPSYNVARFGAHDASTFVRAPTLRGLPPDEILVLVNGKRRHRAAVVHLAGGGSLAAGAQGPDISQIPAIAIERTEVLRDGAAAQYGSDAIAGVINFTLKSRSDTVEIVSRYGQYYAGDGESLTLAANIGLPLGPDGFVNISGEYIDSQQTSRGGVRPSADALSRARPDIASLIPSPPMIIGDPRYEAARMFVNSGLKVGGGELYLFGNYGSARQAMDLNYRQPLSAVGLNRYGSGPETFGRAAQFNTIFLDQIPGSNVYDINGRTFNFISRYPGGFTPRFKSEMDDSSAYIGYKGSLSSGLNYDFSASYGQNEIRYALDNTVNPSMGPESPDNFYLGKNIQEDVNFNADFSYELSAGLYAPITLSAGAEHRTERYVIGAGDPASYIVGPYSIQVLNGENPDPEVSGAIATQQAGANGFPGFGLDSAVDQSRASYAFYVDGETDLSERLSAGVAVRYEHFADFGSTTNYKVSGRYQFTDALAMRATVSTGFRAPTPGQLFTTNIATNFVGATLLETATLPVTNSAAQFFGAVPLKPELSDNYSAGLVFTPGHGLSATLDVYRIDVHDRIGLSGNFNVTTQAQRDELARLGVANAATLGRVRYFTNAFATRTEGIDLVVNHRADTAWGRFNTVVSANYNKTRVTSRETLPVNGVPTLVIDDLRKGNIEHLKPKVRMTLSENWSSGMFSVMARVNYAGSFTSYDLPANGGNLRLGSQATLDLEVSADVTDTVRLSLGVENLFDSYPDRNIRAMGEPNQNLYVATDTTLGANRYVDDSPFGYNGGFWYVRAAIRY